MHTLYAIFDASCRATSTIVRFRVIRKAVRRWKDARLRRYGDRRVIDRSCRKRGGCKQGVDRGSRGEAGMRADSWQSRADRRADRQFLASPLSPPIVDGTRRFDPFEKLPESRPHPPTASRPFAILGFVTSHSRRFWKISCVKPGKSVWPPFMVGKLYNGIWCAWWSGKVRRLYV